MASSHDEAPDSATAPSGRKMFRRPSLERLTEDQRQITRELMEGFGSRRAVLEWSQKLTVRTLGQLPDDWYRQLSEQYNAPESGPQRVVMAAMLTKDARKIRMSKEAARGFRGWVAAETILPGFHTAFRQLRKSATEYVGEGKEPKHDPAYQQYIAMRPGLNELDKWQKEALNACLQGIETVEDVIEWRGYLELATHGEIDGDFIPRCVREGSTRMILHPDSPKDSREAWAAHHLIPAFNRGARDLFSRSGEEAQSLGGYTDDPAEWG